MAASPAPWDLRTRVGLILEIERSFSRRVQPLGTKQGKSNQDIMRALGLDTTDDHQPLPPRSVNPHSASRRSADRAGNSAGTREKGLGSTRLWPLDSGRPVHKNAALGHKLQPWRTRAWTAGTQRIRAVLLCALLSGCLRSVQCLQLAGSSSIGRHPLLLPARFQQLPCSLSLRAAQRWTRISKSQLYDGFEL